MTVTGLIDFTTAYTGGPSYYTGTGTSQLVPDVFPVAIAGHPYLVDQKSGRFGRAFEARVRESVDQNNIPGEATINPQGLWRRSQVSWHKGSGQVYADTGDAQDYRFDTSKNVDPWTKNELKLLPTTSNILSSASTNLPMVVVGSYLYVGDGNTLKYTTNLSSWTDVTTGAPAGEAITALATDGTTVYIGYNDNAIYSSSAGGASVTQYYPTSGSTSYTYNSLKYNKGRIIALHDNHIHLPTGSGGSHTPFYEHPNSSFDFVDSCSGQNAIYAGGNAGQTAIIYKITVKSDGTLDVPVVAAELPLGETLSSLTGYLGFVIIGTSKGVRLASADSNANLVVGPVLETTSAVKCGVGDGKYVWYGWTNFDATSTGLGRLDLSELNGVNEPAYASDLMVSEQGAVNAVVNWNGTRIFTVAGEGVYRESTDLCAEGYIETGVWRWGIPDRKFLPRFDTRTKPLAGSITTAFSFDEATYVNLPAVVNSGSTEKTTIGPETGFSQVAIKITLKRSGTSNTAGPTLTRWQARAYAAPIRARIFSVPVILHRKVNVHGSEFYVDVKEELAYLEGLVNDASIVSYQESYDSYNVVVENVEWIPLDARNSNWDWEGTAVVTLRSIAD
jgi:hypothetical protein